MSRTSKNFFNPDGFLCCWISQQKETVLVKALFLHKTAGANTTKVLQAKVHQAGPDNPWENLSQFLIRTHPATTTSIDIVHLFHEPGKLREFLLKLPHHLLGAHIHIHVPARIEIFCRIGKSAVIGRHLDLQVHRLISGSGGRCFRARHRFV